MDDSGAADSRHALVGLDHAPDPLHLARDVAVVGTVTRAGRDQFRPVPGERSGRRADNPGSCGDRIHGDRVVTVTDEKG